MSKNSQRLGAALSNRMKQTSKGAIPTTMELGIVNANFSITTDSLMEEIPKGDYLVNLMLAGGKYPDKRFTSTESHTHSGGAHAQEIGSGSHTHSDGAHAHELPDGFRYLKAGDRVLVAWCGNEPVVIAIVVSS